MLMTGIPELEMLSVNTDGLTSIVPRDKEDKYLEICKEWEELTKLSLEHVTFNKYVLRDVNNFSAQTTDGKLKYKGAFKPHAEMVKDGEFHKAFNQGIVPIALSKYYFEGIDPKETIENHTNIYDFCKTYNATHGWKCETLDIDKEGNESNHKEEQKNNRYYISKNGKKFRKYKDTRIIEIEASDLVIIFNKFVEKPFEKYDIDYNYYIQECYKIIDVISGEKERREIEKREERIRLKREKEEENYLKMCINKIPTEKQWEACKRDYLIEKFGMPSEIKPSKKREKKEDQQLALLFEDIENE